MSGRLLAWCVFVAAFAALSYASRLGGGTPPPDALYQYKTAVGALFQFAIMLGIVLLIARGRVRELFALRRPTSWGRAIAISLGILVAIGLVGAALSPFLDPGEEQGLLPSRWRPERAEAFAANFAVITLGAPVVEEITFRGVGFSLLARFGRPLAIVVVGIAFGLAHGLLEALPLLTAFGIGLAYLRSRTDSVYPPIALHAVFNATALLFAVR